MASKDYIPSKDGDIVPWTENFVLVASTNAAALGLATTDINALKTKNADYVTKLNAAIAKQSESKAATEAKNFQKDAVVDNIRTLVRQVQAKPGVPDTLKAQLGINIPSPTPAPTAPYPPKDLSAELTSGGQCLLKWNRNSNIQGVIFVIESSTSPDGLWQIIGTCTKLSYESHLTAALGHNYFRVKAQRGSTYSQASNVVVL